MKKNTGFELCSNVIEDYYCKGLLRSSYLTSHKKWKHFLGIPMSCWYWIGHQSVCHLYPLFRACCIQIAVFATT